MPRLCQYRTRAGSYVLTAIAGAVVTFQLTPEGERRLLHAGIAPNQIFPRALLLDLYRSGDAYTGQSGTEGAATPQLELDFSHDPEPESIFPTCDICGKSEDLHVVLQGDAGNLRAWLYCHPCRLGNPSSLDSLIPLWLLNRPSLVRLMRLKQVGAASTGIEKLQALLDAEFSSQWAAVSRRRPPAQPGLFAPDDTGDLPLK